MTELESRATDLYQTYFSSAIQYYVAGRYAVFAGLDRIAGNLLHHAIEMAIEGYLAKTSPALDLKKTYKKHPLNTLWRDFKAGVAKPSLDTKAFNIIVSELDKFETIRYPDHVVNYGMLTRIASHPRADEAKSGKGSGTKAPKYGLYLPDIDALFTAIITASGVPPEFFAGELCKPEARDFLMRGNASNLWT